jgi:uncharacterized protein with HEPN domain
VSSKSPRQRIQDIVEAAARIRSYVEGLSFEAFSSDQRTIDAVVRNFEVIGEAAKHIDPLPGYAVTEWRRIRSMRDRLIHDYAAVSIPIVWQTIQVQLGMLEKAAQAEAKRLAANDPEGAP